MKRFFAHTILTIAFIMLPMLAAISQPPPPPSHSEPGDDQLPAPIGTGLGVLMLLAGGYGAKKVYDARKKLRE